MNCLVDRKKQLVVNFCDKNAEQVCPEFNIVDDTNFGWHWDELPCVALLRMVAAVKAAAVVLVRAPWGLEAALKELEGTLPEIKKLEMSEWEYDAAFLDKLTGLNESVCANNKGALRILLKGSML